jgi:uncharacterized Zn finger protein (UPF0148 family)
MADLLRSGNTMLNIACPVCNNPIFRKRDGNTYCPTCNRNVLIVKEDTHKGNVMQKSEIIHEKQENRIYNRKTELLYSLQDVILEKIEIITKKLRNETHSQVIEINTKILLNCLDILNKIPLSSKK